MFDRIHFVRESTVQRWIADNTVLSQDIQKKIREGGEYTWEKYI